VSRPTAAILLTGSELLRGVISDRNASHLSERLEALGFEMRRTLMVGDPLADIESAVRELCGAHDLVVTSGGLGPTHDDRTVEALAGVAAVPLELDEQVLGQITAWTDGVANRMGFERERFAAGNRKQARIPRGAAVLGLAGTAPGLVMEMNGSTVVVLPGVPSELRRLWEMAPGHPRLAGLMARAEPRRRRLLRTYGIGESHVADLFAEAGGDPPGVETSICARNYEIEIDIRATPDAEAEGERLWRGMRERLGSHVFATDERSAAELVLDAARARGLTLATAESCTGGMVAAELTAIPGSSEVFVGAAVTYSNRLKHDLVGVPEWLIAEHGAVSAEVAEAMARGARDRLGADVAVAVTGIAGPGGGSEEKPVGLVHLHVSGDGRETPSRMQWGGRRSDIRLRATVAALHAILEHFGAHP
jgi:competence/damage-inducible protein CinA-like protein